jgi:dihydroflavonol-4-reductase
MKVLLTGASGMLGRHILERLSTRGYRVRALYHSHLPKETYDQVEWQCCDIRDMEQVDQALAGMDIVIHAAAMVSYDIRDAQKLLHTNAEGTANLINCCLYAGVKKCVHISSIATLGLPKDKEPITEKTFFDPDKKASQYALSKYLAEMEVWRGMAEGLDVVVLNPSVILGEGSAQRSSTHLFEIIRKGFPFYTQGVTGWVDARDVAEATIRLMESEQVNERFIINEGNYSFQFIFQTMAAAFGVNPPRWHAAKWLTGLAWRWYYIKSLLTGSTATITRETASASQRLQEYDNSKLQNALPDFHYTPITETIARVAASIQKDRVVSA